MRKLSCVVIFLSAFLFAGRASATTYYISFSSGSNANSGTSESAPWKSHPYMQSGSACTGTGSAPKYSHSAGDQFVFKQGDSWPNACFDMVIAAGGSSPSNPDVYTFDPTWGTAGGTKGNLGQPVGTYQFNAGGSLIRGADGINFFINQNSINYITYNGMELVGQTWSGSNSNVEAVDLQDSEYTIFSNIYAHGWSHPGASTDDLSIINGRNASPNNVGTRLTGSVIDGAGASDSGEATYAIPLADNNIIRNMSNGLIVGQNAIVHDNLIGPINQSFDSSDHENCIEPIGNNPGVASTNYYYNNVWHDCTAVAILTSGGAPSSGWEIDYLWNNVAYVGSVPNPPIPMEFSNVNNSGSSSGAIYAWNNTVYGGSTAVCFRTLNQGSGSFGPVLLVNNHCISDQGLLMNGLGNPTQSGNVTQSVSAAAAAGYSASERYAYSPTSASSPTVGAGSNQVSVALGNIATLLMDTTYAGPRTPNSRPLTGTWDAGAYQFSSSAAAAPPTPPTNVKVVGVQ